LDDVRALREEFWRDVRVAGPADRLNQELERAGRVADFLELAELMVLDALDRTESCGAHFREEHALADGEAARDDEHWCNVSAWETTPEGRHVRHLEELSFALVPLAVRNYR
ncbi:fumarate reductase/succinate dehydrogenase flavoprotein subunit, partial [Tessaracoccus lubricantis]